MIGNISGLSPVSMDPSMRVSTPITLAPSRPAPAPLPLRSSPSNATDPLTDDLLVPRSVNRLESDASRADLSLPLLEIQSEFEIDEETNRIKVTVHNTHTGQILRRIPLFELRGVYRVFRDNLGLDGPISI